MNSPDDLGFGQMYPGGNQMGFGQNPSYSPYPPAQGGAPYPPAGGVPYPPAGGVPYPPASGSPYPPAPGGAPYLPAGGAPYPPAGGAPYPPASGSPYPPAPGGSPYPPAQGGSLYPPGPGGSPYPPAQGGSPYPPAQGGSAYPPAPGGSPYPPQGGRSSPYPPNSGASQYPPAQGGRSSPYPPNTGASQYPPAQGGSPYPGAPGGSPYPSAPGASPYPGAQSYQPVGATHVAQSNATYGQPGAGTGYPGTGQPGADTGYPGTGQPGAGTGYPGAGMGGPMPGSGYSGVGSNAPGQQRGGSLLQYTEIPTVKPQAHFDPSGDGSVLRKAMKGFGTDEAAIINILSHRTSHERQQIMLKYQQSYGKDLIKDLKGELSGKFEDVVIALMTPLPIYLARELHEAMAGIGTKEGVLVEILCTRDNASLLMIKNAYYQEYHKKLEDDIRGDTSGDFERLLISMCACSRDEVNCDTALANNLAQQLYKAGEGKTGTNEGEFNRILASYSYPLLRCVFEEYKKIKGKSFGDALKSELSGDLKTGMVAVYHAIENRSGYFARALHNSMAGMGTHDRSLIRLVVSRCEIDMGNIKQDYHKLYNKPLEEAIKNDISGDYKKLLIGMVEN